MQGLAGGTFQGAAFAVENLHCQLMGAAAEPLQGEDWAAAGFTGRLAVEDQTVVVGR